MDIQHSTEVLQKVREKTKRVNLFFSCGKDSLCLLDLCSKHFDHVNLVFMYFVKDLEHINKYLRLAEAKYKNVTVIQVPHWTLTHTLRNGVYCDAQPKIKLLKLADIDEAVRLKTGVNWSVFGMKKSDSLNRNLMLKTYDMEAVNWAQGKVYPLSHWKDRDVLRYIRDKGMPAPINYEGKKKSNGVGFDLTVFLWLRTNYPEDLAKILKTFPMASRILFEHDYKEKNKSKLS